MTRTVIIDNITSEGGGLIHGGVGSYTTCMLEIKVNFNLVVVNFLAIIWYTISSKSHHTSHGDLESTNTASNA